MFKDFFFLAARSILHRRLRSWLTVIGIVIGITAVVALISIGLSLQRTVTNEVGKVFGYDTFLIMGQGAFGSQRGFDQGVKVNLDTVQAVAGVRAVAAIRSETGLVHGPAVKGGKPKQGFLPVMGLSPELKEEFSSFLGELTLAPGGRFFSKEDTDTVILGDAVAADLHANLGAMITLEKRPFRVIGILTASATKRSNGPFVSGSSDNANTIFVPFKAMDELFGKNNKVLLVLVKTAPGNEVDEVADRVKAKLTATGDSKVETVTYSDISKQIGVVMGALSGFLAGIAGISLLVGGVGVMNTMYTSVLERTREIGVLKAVGAKRSHILTIFLIESGLMGLVGGMIGIVLGLGLSGVAALVITRLFNVHLISVVSPAVILGTLFLSFFLGAIAGYFPARRAAKLPPVEALRYE